MTYGNDIDRIMANHPSIGHPSPYFKPESIGVRLVRVRGNFQRGEWSIYDGDVLGGPVFSFGQDVDSKVSRAPHKFSHGSYTFRRVRDRRSPVPGMPDMEFRYLEYKLVA